MTTVVIMPGGFHPFHAGHLALYQSAQRAFPDAEVFVAATNDTSARPFPFAVKEKLAKLAGVEPGHFVQVKSPFRAEEITSRFDPATDNLIFVRSEKDAGQPPKPGGIKKDGNPTYLQPLLGAKRLEPFAKHAYMAYLPTVEFGPGMTSATEIRAAWPTLNDKRKTALVMSLYPKTQGNPKLAQTVVKLLDTAMGSGLDEDLSRRGFLKGAGAAAVAGAAGSAMAQNQSGRVAGLRAKLAREVGVLDVDSKNYDNISGAPKLFLFAENGSNFIMQWIDKEGNELGEPIIFGAGKNATDARGNQITMFFGPKIAVKIQGDYIFVTPRSWIENKIGWQYAYSEVPNIFAMMKRESVNYDLDEGWVGALTGGALGLFGGPVGALFGAWIGHALQEGLRANKAKTQNLMARGDIYQVYFDSKDISGKLFSYIDAFDKMTDLAKKPHDIEKYFDIVDSTTGNSVFKYRAKADASNFLKKMAIDNRDELRQAQLNQTHDLDSATKFDLTKINLDFNYFTPGFVNRVEGIAKSNKWDILKAAGYLQELSNTNDHPFGHPTDWQKLKTLVSNDYNTESLKTLGQTLKTEFKKSKEHFKTKESVNQGVAEVINPMTANTSGSGAGMTASYQARENQPVAEVRVIDPARVDVFFRPNKRSLKKTVIAQNIPANALDALINLLSKKYNVYPDDFEWGPSAQGPEPFGRQVESQTSQDYMEEARS